MGNYLKMPDKRRLLALLELGWSYRRIERETGVRRETVARYDPRRQSKAANLSTGSESASDEEAESESKADNVSAGSSQAHGPPGVAEPYRAQSSESELDWSGSGERGSNPRPQLWE